jgi:hypothetical protein
VVWTVVLTAHLGGIRKKGQAWCQWFTPVILTTQEVRNQPGEIVCETLSPRNPSQKRAGGVTQGVGPQFKPQYQKKKGQ